MMLGLVRETDEGAEVKNGLKYVLRTNIMYRLLE
jgi:hypothetical protein